MALLQAVKALNANEVYAALASGYSCDYTDDFGRTYVHIAVDLIKDEDEDIATIQTQARCEIIYMLSDAGVNLNKANKDGDTCLWSAVRNSDSSSCDTLLQCGADMHATCETGNSILYEVFEECHKQGDQSSELTDVFQKYYPGLWRAVECRDICQVRRLTNLWCKTDLKEGNKTLKELALEVGHEEIISLIFGIHDTMELIHHVMARNIRAVQCMLENSKKNLQLDLRKMVERGAPILYYLIQWKDAKLTDLFVKHGCHVYTVMRDEYGSDMPVLFSALQHDMPVQVIKALLPENRPQQEQMLYKLLYQGSTILEVALRNHVPLDVFDILVDRGGPLLIMDRNQFNQSARDIAVGCGKTEHAEVIDKNVSAWITNPARFPGRRKALALYGWDHMEDVITNDNISVEDDLFLSLLSDYESQIEELVIATEAGNVEEFVRLKEFLCQRPLFENKLSWDSRLKGDGLPLLHRAVLFNYSEIVKLILEDIPDDQSVDTLFDQHHRTALHYAYASPACSEVKKMLLDNGCSEHVLDRNSKEPLDFKDKQGSGTMMLLLDRLKTKDYNSPEPNPWSSGVTYHKCHNFCGQDCYCKSHNYQSKDDDTNCEENTDSEYVENDTESEHDAANSQWTCSIL